MIWPHITEGCRRVQGFIALAQAQSFSNRTGVSWNAMQRVMTAITTYHFSPPA